MPAPVDRRSVDLSAYPDLVMILLGFRLKGWRGLLAMRRIGPGLNRIARERPDGLLAHEDMRFGLTHFGFRQYWRDVDALGRFTRSEPHADWWRRIQELSQGAGFWHETFHAKGGVEALYVAMPAGRPPALRSRAGSGRAVHVRPGARAGRHGGGELGAHEEVPDPRDQLARPADLLRARRGGSA